jgi:hypothetical protein
VTEYYDSKTAAEAMKRPDKRLWKEAMDEEMKSLEV